MVFRDRARVFQRWRVRGVDSRLRSNWGRFMPDSGQGGRVEEELRPRVVNRLIFSVFLTNFSDEISWKDLKQVGKDFGIIDDVFIPKKRDINNKRFAFIHYMGNVDQEMILNALNGVILRGRRLIAKRAIAGGTAKGQRTLGGAKIDDVKYGGSTINNGERKSFRNALMNERQDKDDDIQKQLYLVAEPVMLPLKLQKGTLWGEVNDLETLDDLQNLLIQDGINISKVTYLGGLNVLISFTSDSEATDFKENICIWEGFFKIIKIWDGAQSEEKKIVRINISGLPIPFREAANYNKVAALFGRVVGPSDFSWDNLTVNGSSVMVLVDKLVRIHDLVKIYWRGGEYVVKVIEDGLGWEPGFVNAVIHYGSETSKEEGDASMVQEGDEEEDWLISEDEELLHSLSNLYSPPGCNTLTNENGTTSHDSEVGIGVAEQERLPKNELVPETDTNAQSDSTSDDISRNAASASVEADCAPKQTVVLVEDSEGNNIGGLGMQTVETKLTQDTHIDLEGIEYGTANKKENSLTGGTFTDPAFCDSNKASLVNPKITTTGKTVDKICRRSARIANKSESLAEKLKQTPGGLNFSSMENSMECLNTRDDGVKLGFQVNECLGDFNNLLATERGKCNSS